MIGNKDTDLSLFEFQSKFTSDRDCIEYLSTMKWSKGFECKKCKHTHYCKGVKEFDRQCTRCRSIESPTAGTLFHRVRFHQHQQERHYQHRVVSKIRTEAKNMLAI